MTINQLAINPKGLKFRFVSAVEHFAYQDGERVDSQTKDEDTGYPLWKVRVTIVNQEAEAATTAVVTVPSLEPPSAEFDSEVTFEDLTVKFWVMNGTLGQNFQATKVITNNDSAGPKPAPRKPTAAPTGA